MDDRLTPSWSPIEALPVALLAYLGTIVVGTLFGLLLGRDLGLVLAQVALGVLLAVVTVTWVRSRHGAWRGPLGLGERPRAAELWYGAGAGLAIFAITTLVVAPLFFALVSFVTGEPVVAPQQEVLPEEPASLHIAITGVAVILAAPAGEELFFRGFLFGGLRRRMGFWTAALISSAVFAFTHYLPLLMPLLFVVGLGLAWVYERRGSLWPCMAAHAAFNVVGYVLIVQRA